MSSLTLIKNASLGDYAQNIHLKILPEAQKLMKLKVNVGQIQQILTDISLTHSESVINNGFESAESEYNKASEAINSLLADYSYDSSLAHELSSLLELLIIYYDTGVQMAKTYINIGGTEGNLLMGKFDPIADELNSKLDILIDDTLATLESDFNQIYQIQVSIQVISLITMIITPLGGIIIGILLLWMISKGLKLVKRYSSNLADGVLNNRENNPGKDEFGTLAADFNSSFDSLSSLIENLKASAEQEYRLNDHLSEAAGDVSSSVAQMDASMNEMSRQVEQQDNIVSEAAAAVNQIAANLSSLSKQIDSQSAAVSSSTASVEQMAASINNVAGMVNERSSQTSALMNQLETTSTNMDNTEKIIRQVAELSRSMRNITEVINKISAQTNLLAMNAAIEAAHAGDSGRGFAVVASEIRKLAEETGSNAHLIDETLGRITGIVEEAYAATEENQRSFQNVEKGIEDFTETFKEINSAMAQLSTGTTDITGSVTALSDITSQIQSASAEINSGSEDVNRSMSILHDLSRSVLNGIRETAAGVNVINEAMSRLKDISTESMAYTDKVRHDIDQFTV